MSVKTAKHATHLIVVMGTTGCGKSTTGTALAAVLDATYLEGDDYHSLQNKEKMSAGTALTDTDRWPWLKTLAQAMAEQSGITVTSCSSLKKSYRRYISDNAREPVLFVHLNGSKETIAKRLAARQDHFMDTGLLDSQLATLEPLEKDEYGFTVNIDQSVAQIVASIVSQLP